MASDQNEDVGYHWNQHGRKSFTGKLQSPSLNNKLVVGSADLSPVFFFFFFWGGGGQA